MSDSCFNPVPFIEESGAPVPVSLDATPFFFNNSGTPTYLAQLPPNVPCLTPAPTNPELAFGREYMVADILGVQPNGKYGVETQLDLPAQEVVYEPMWVTPIIAAAFGITLVAPGQAVRMTGPKQGIAQIDYNYGVFAGHWSPYQNTGNRLLTTVCTDLEHHDFPHVFASVDAEFPLVTSVARYWPALGKIRLADLWVPRGYALYIPPKKSDPNAVCIDLHNNRNSARALWGNLHRDTLSTKTLLQPEGGFFYWYWNAKATVHTSPDAPSL